MLSFVIRQCLSDPTVNQCCCIVGRMEVLAPVNYQIIDHSFWLQQVLPGDCELRQDEFRPQTVNRCGCRICDITHWFVHDRYVGVDSPSRDSLFVNFYTWCGKNPYSAHWGRDLSQQSHQSMAKTTSNWALVSQTGHKCHFVWTKWQPWPSVC